MRSIRFALGAILIFLGMIAAPLLLMARIDDLKAVRGVLVLDLVAGCMIALGGFLIPQSRKRAIRIAIVGGVVTLLAATMNLLVLHTRGVAYPQLFDAIIHGS